MTGGVSPESGSRVEEKEEEEADVKKRMFTTAEGVILELVSCAMESLPRDPYRRLTISTQAHAAVHMPSLGVKTRWRTGAVVEGGEEVG